MRNRDPKKTFIGIIIILIVIGLIIGGIALFNYLNYKKTYDYKLGEIGYSKEEIKIIGDKLSNTLIDEIVMKEPYNKSIKDIITYKYFINDNLLRYLNYQKKEPSLNIDTIIRVVNVNGDYEPYTNVVDSKIEDGNLILVNKYHKLGENHEFTNLENISLMYAYSNNRLQEEAVTNFVRMARAAKEEGLKIIANSSYRSYEEQDNIYNSFLKKHGTEYAEEYSAHAGYSEHETGLAVDIDAYQSSADDFENSNEYAWLLENSYKYGYILRYPKDKEIITGYSYEPWHYRYVGIDAAKVIHDEDITFDEYYLYYVNK